MRLIILVILLSYVQMAIGQSDTLDITITEIFSDEDDSPEYVEACNEERQRAIKDIQAGILKVENYIGLTFEKKDFGFEDFYTNYLISKYRIEQQTTGCTSGRSRICYFEEMNKVIIERHGLTSDELRNAANKEYEQFKLLDSEGRKNYIDFNYVYWKVDERADYPAGRDDLEKKLRGKIDFKKFDFSKYGLEGFHAEVVVDEEGNVLSCQVLSKDFPKDANEAIQKAIKELGNWKAAVLFGSKVKSKTWFSFML